MIHMDNRTTKYHIVYIGPLVGLSGLPRSTFRTHSWPYREGRHGRPRSLLAPCLTESSLLDRRLRARLKYVIRILSILRRPLLMKVRRLKSSWISYLLFTSHAKLLDLLLHNIRPLRTFLTLIGLRNVSNVLFIRITLLLVAFKSTKRCVLRVSHQWKLIRLPK